MQVAAFTPSDASHLTGSHGGWERAGAELGARLLMRAASIGGGRADDPRFDSVEAFGRAACRHVSERVALALADAAAAEEFASVGRRSGTGGNGLTASQLAMIERGFGAIPETSGIADGRDGDGLDEGRDDGVRGGGQGDGWDDEQGTSRSDGAPPVGGARNAVPLLGVRVALGLPIAGLGAPAASYHAAAAHLLGTRALLPVHGDVANALGAVVGQVRQEARVTVVAAGGHRARALLASGPEERATLEDAVALATREARSRAIALAVAAGVRADDVPYPLLTRG